MARVRNFLRRILGLLVEKGKERKRGEREADLGGEERASPFLALPRRAYGASPERRLGEEPTDLTRKRIAVTLTRETRRSAEIVRRKLIRVRSVRRRTSGVRVKLPSVNLTSCSRIRRNGLTEVRGMANGRVNAVDIDRDTGKTRMLNDRVILKVTQITR